MRIFATLLFCLLSCGPATGKVQIFITPEDTVTEGIDPGENEENMRDGWTIRYSKFVVTLGDFRAESTADATQKLQDTGTYVIDLTTASSAGVELLVWDAPAIRFDRFGYSFLKANAESKLLGSTTQADHDTMVAQGLSLWVQGTLEKDGKTLRFDWPFTGETRAGACGSEGGQAGFAATAGGTTSIKPTIHGDHWFFTNSPHTTVPLRRAQWIADCDDNDDDEVTLDELRAHQNVAELFPASKGYNLSSLPIQPITSAYDYFAAQARSLGHFNGDGDCEALEVID